MLKDGVRDPWPDQVVWAMSDDVLKHFYWLEAPHPVPTGGSRPPCTTIRSR